MLSTKDYIWAVAFGAVCGFIAYLLLPGKDSALLQCGVIGLVGAAGSLYGNYNRAKERQGNTKDRISKKSIKKMKKGK